MAVIFHVAYQHITITIPARSPIHASGHVPVSNVITEVNTGGHIPTPCGTSELDTDTEPIYDDVNVCKCAWQNNNRNSPPPSPAPYPGYLSNGLSLYWATP